ncbi:hypothetical protein DENSPDRAFT_877988 [Dentipellis sp. KUC8613]|nr:hypothetical protein DENSPDRAFT_877988 [Dentipellis sp. KUC8613]
MPCVAITCAHTAVTRSSVAVSWLVALCSPCAPLCHHHAPSRSRHASSRDRPAPRAAISTPSPSLLALAPPPPMPPMHVALTTALAIVLCPRAVASRMRHPPCHLSAVACCLVPRVRCLRPASSVTCLHLVFARLTPPHPTTAVSHPRLPSHNCATLL